MPIYSFRCNQYQNIFDLLIGVSAEKADLRYIACGSAHVKKTIISFSVGGSQADKPCLDGETCMPHVSKFVLLSVMRSKEEWPMVAP